MTEVKMTVHDLYNQRAYIEGFKFTAKDGSSISCLGLVNEEGVTEGTKRIINKISKKIKSELETIDKQRQGIEADEKYKDKEAWPEDKAKEDKEARDKEILDDEVTISFEELVDFTKVENLSLSYNYAAVYEKVFKNY